MSILVALLEAAVILEDAAAARRLAGPLEVAANLVAGAALVAQQSHSMQLLHQPRTYSGWSRIYLQAFRTVVVASCAVFAAYGWIAHIQWLLAASLTIGLGEFVECTYYLIVLDWGQRSRGIEI